MGSIRSSSEDIAEAAGVTARALYRHYDNKQALLAAVIRTAQENYLHAREPDGPRGDAPARQLDVEPDLISAAIATRALTVLWARGRATSTRPTAPMSQPDQHNRRGDRRQRPTGFPDLDPATRAAGVGGLSTMTSLGRHNSTLPRDDLTAVLRRVQRGMHVPRSWATWNRSGAPRRRRRPVLPP